AQLRELQEYRDLHLVQADRVLLCVIGGVKVETLQPTMEEQLGSINLTSKTLPPATATLKTAKDHVVPWDINVTHYMETYAIPNVEHRDYPALYMASLLLRIACMQDAQLKELIGHVFCGIDLITPEQIYLYVNASLKSDTDIEKGKERIGELIDQLKQPEKNAMVPMYAMNLSMQLASPPDIALIMQQKPIGITEDMMLGNIGLQWGMLVYQYGDALPKLASALASVTASDVADVVNRYLTKDKRMTLLLTPPSLK
ncbi:insulinase family protein, partial [Candidatus Poribacteria bacterium]|nr:insulinase family protein [Candidatus Poribacteria bacterium]